MKGAKQKKDPYSTARLDFYLTTNELVGNEQRAGLSALLLFQLFYGSCAKFLKALNML